MTWYGAMCRMVGHPAFAIHPLVRTLFPPIAPQVLRRTVARLRSKLKSLQADHRALQEAAELSATAAAGAAELRSELARTREQLLASQVRSNGECLFHCRLDTTFIT